MPFPLLIPLIASLVGSVGGAAATKLLNRGGGGGRKDTRHLIPLSPEEQESLDWQSQLSELFKGFSTDFAKTTQESTGKAFDFAKSLMDMDPATLAQFFAPEVERQQKSRQAGLSSIERFLPRGGERDRAYSDFISGSTADMARMWSSARPTAAKMFTDIAGITAPVALGFGGEAVQAGQGPLSFLASRRASDVGFRGQDMQRDLGFGQGIGSIISQLLPLLLKSGGGGGSGQVIHAP